MGRYDFHAQCVGSQLRTGVHFFAATSMKALSRAMLAAALFGSLAPAPSSAAESYPKQPIRLVIPFTAGGGTDVAARIVAQYLAPRLGQPIVPENRGGASAAVGANVVAKSSPDGYTLLVGTATLAGNSVIPNANLPFDLINDFDFIGKLGRIDLLIVSNPKSKLNDLRDLVNLMRSNPDAVQFGSPGVGSPSHLGGELLKQLTKTHALHIPYKGESAGLNDLLGGQTTFQLCSAFVCAPRVRDGSLKALAVASKRRSSLVPTVPTTAEAGFPGVEADTWYFLAAPKGTPAPVIRKLTETLNATLSDESLKGRLQAIGVEADANNPAAVRKDLQAEINKWRPVVKAAGITSN
ncbi:Bug family tripartite tricarboxylate transporter substrate binding protein [Cupriavidus yeoncheonensis]|nr:tripartite tricarboxylate transporter substrate-binding protein [Cupriavidus yeoncheonensis]